MIPRRLLLLIMTLGMIWLGSGAAAEGDDLAPFGVLDGATLSCSVAAPSWTTGCFLEKRVAVFGPVEFALGVDAQAVFTTGEYHLAPFAILAVYMEGWSAWGEFAIPGSSVPIIGRPDWARIGISITLGGETP